MNLVKYYLLLVLMDVLIVGISCGIYFALPADLGTLFGLMFVMALSLSKPFLLENYLRRRNGGTLPAFFPQGPLPYGINITAKAHMFYAYPLNFITIWVTYSLYVNYLIYV
jgi:hypothetical protein